MHFRGLLSPQVFVQLKWLFEGEAQMRISWLTATQLLRMLDKAIPVTWNFNWNWCQTTKFASIQFYFCLLVIFWIILILFMMSLFDRRRCWRGFQDIRWLHWVLKSFAPIIDAWKVNWFSSTNLYAWAWHLLRFRNTVSVFGRVAVFARNKMKGIFAFLQHSWKENWPNSDSIIEPTTFQTREGKKVLREVSFCLSV